MNREIDGHVLPIIDATKTAVEDIDALRLAQANFLEAADAAGAAQARKANRAAAADLEQRMAIIARGGGSAGPAKTRAALAGETTTFLAQNAAFMNKVRGPDDRSRSL